jgi:major membrane immunogen (membrane-anchored lipoprotein)
MKKLLVVVLAVLLLLVACSKPEEKVTNEGDSVKVKQEKVVKEEIKAEETAPIENLLGIAAHYENSGYKVVTGDKMFFTMIGAIDGESWTINQSEVEVYKYKSEDEAESNVEVVQTQLEDQGTVVSNKEFLMVFYNPIDESIINTFKEIK